MASYIIIDINGLGYAAMYQPDLASLSCNGFQTSGIHGALFSVFSIMKKFKNHTPIIVWDGKSVWRNTLYPEYKSNRNNTPEKLSIKESYGKQVPIIKKILWEAGIPQIMSLEAEADDIAGELVEHKHEDDKIVLVTSDSDWYQVIGKDVSLYHQSKKKILTLGTFMVDTIDDGGFQNPKQYITCKAISGDLQTDNIPGVSGIGLKTALKFIEEFDTLENIWQLKSSVGKIKSKKLVELVNNRDLVERNLKLIDWSFAPKIEKLSLLSGSYQEDTFAQLCLEFELSGVFKTWVALAANEPISSYASDANKVFDSIDY
jgi:DNA polymerase-1